MFKNEHKNYATPYHLLKGYPQEWDGSLRAFIQSFFLHGIVPGICFRSAQLFRILAKFFIIIEQIKTIRKTKFILWIVKSKDVHCPMTEFDEFELVRRLNSWLYCSISILQSNQCLSIYTLLVCLFLSFSKPIDRVQILCLTSRDFKEGLWMVKI